MHATRRQLFQNTLRILDGPKSPFPQYSAAGRNVTFDKNFPVHKQKKKWEIEGESKDSWFKRKHAHHHAAQKKREEERGFSRNNRKSKKDRDIDDRDAPRRSLRETLKRIKVDGNVDYVYGTNSVLSALRANVRSDLGPLYIFNPKGGPKHQEILDLAEKLEIMTITDKNKHDLNVLSNNGVHNGYVIESRRLQPTEITELGECNYATGEYQVMKRTILAQEPMTLQVARFSEIDEEVVPNEVVPVSESAEAELKDSQEVDEVESVEEGKPGVFPLGLYLDEIADPHNLGAIIRSAYFLGVDFIVVSERNCAPLSPAVSKVSSGAMEFMPIFMAKKPLQFFEDSIKNQWSIVSSLSTNDLIKHENKSIDANYLSDLLRVSPVLLAIGSEGTGIRTSLVNRSNYVVGYESDRMDLDDSVDSLNASVATALLISKCLS